MHLAWRNIRLSSRPRDLFFGKWVYAFGIRKSGWFLGCFYPVSRLFWNLEADFGADRAEIGFSLDALKVPKEKPAFAGLVSVPELRLHKEPLNTCPFRQFSRPFGQSWPLILTNQGRNSPIKLNRNPIRFKIGIQDAPEYFTCVGMADGRHYLVRINADNLSGFLTREPFCRYALCPRRKHGKRESVTDIQLFHLNLLQKSDPEFRSGSGFVSALAERRIQKSPLSRAWLVNLTPRFLVMAGMRHSSGLPFGCAFPLPAPGPYAPSAESRYAYLYRATS